MQTFLFTKKRKWTLKWRTKKIKRPDNVEAVIPGNALYIKFDNLKIIENQKDNSICKIIKNGKPTGTGFLCYISRENKKTKTLITAHHVLKEEDLEIGKEIYLSFNDDKKKIK